jgi:hypothetical protein
MSYLLSITRMGPIMPPIYFLNLMGKYNFLLVREYRNKRSCMSREKITQYIVTERYQVKEVL